MLRKITPTKTKYKDLFPSQESSCNAPELRGVLNGKPRVPCQLRLEVDWSHAWLAVRHDRTFEDVKRIGELMEEQTIRPMLDGDAEEVVKRPEILHGEFPLKSENGTCSSSVLDAVRMILST
jgi:hypothetical protein